MRRLCPNCEELLKPSVAGSAYCAGCGWIGTFADARREPQLPETPPKMSYVSIDIETTGLDSDTCQTLEVGAVIDDWKTPIDQLPRFRRRLVHETVSGNPYAMWLNADLLKAIATTPKDPPQPVHEAVAMWAERCAIKRDVRPIGTMLFGAHPYICWQDIPNTLLGMLPPHEWLGLVADPPGIGCCCQPPHLAGLFYAWIKAHGLDPKSVQAAGKNFASFDMQFLYRLPRFKETITFRHRILDPAILFWRPLEDERLPDSKMCYERAGINGKVAHTAVEDALAVVRLVRMGVKHLEGMKQ